MQPAFSDFTLPWKLRPWLSIVMREAILTVLVASAVFPLIAVALSVIYLGERPVANQYVGVALTATGLIVLGLS